MSTALPAPLKESILSQPLYRQKDIKPFFGYPSDSSLEQGRLGIGAFSGLKFTRIGRSVLYPSNEVVNFLEALPRFSNTTEADQFAKDGGN